MNLLRSKVPSTSSSSDDDDTSGKSRGSATRPKRRRSKPLKVSNQIPAGRREEIEKALEGNQGTPARWSRKDGPKYHRFLRKRISPGTIRQLEYDLIDVEIGESWPIPITVIHGARPGPVVTLLGAIHGNELVGPLALTYLSGPNFVGEDKAIVDFNHPLAGRTLIFDVTILNVWSVASAQSR